MTASLKYSEESGVSYHDRVCVRLHSSGYLPTSGKAPIFSAAKEGGIPPGSQQASLCNGTTELLSSQEKNC